MNGLFGWTRRWRALRELKDLERQEDSKLQLDEGNFINRAKAAISAGDTVAASRFWQEALEHYPRFARTSHDSLEILLRLQRFDEAEALMLDGQKQGPRDSFYATGFALVAERRGDIQEAIRRWGIVRSKFPTSWMGYVHGAACLCAVGESEAAEPLNMRAIKRFQNEAQAWIGSARTAEHRRDWQEAVRRWEMVRDKFGQVREHDIASRIGIARGLEGLGKFDEAEQLLIELQIRWPVLQDIALALGRLAELRGDDEKAIVRWADARRRFPVLRFGYREGLRHLVGIGRFEDAEVILLAAIDRFPAEEWPAVQYASIAHTRRDWEAAATRWAAVRAGWPDRQDGYLRGAEACVALGRQDEAAQLRAEHQSRFPR